MEVNFFGPMRLMKALIPHMREQKQGVIINVSSAVFWTAHPGVGMYAASKFALEGKSTKAIRCLNTNWVSTGLSESVFGELAPFGIRVIIAEPGEMRTKFVDADKVSNVHVPDAYKGTPAESVLSFITQRDGKQDIDPKRVANAIVQQVINSPSPDPPLRLPLGTECLEFLTSKASSLSKLAHASVSLAKDCDFPKI
jgi:NAD(P)-dependent dehydrogenase (short-subunit alcohol dehydrogenase family)